VPSYSFSLCCPLESKAVQAGSVLRDQTRPLGVVFCRKRESFAESGAQVLEATQSWPAQRLCPREHVLPLNLGCQKGTVGDAAAQVLEMTT